MIYLASPYSHPDPIMSKTRFLLAQQVTAELLAQGKFIYSPIVHCHEFAVAHSIPKEFEFWRAYNLDMLRRADALMILTIPGWRESEGVAAEWAAARCINLPISFVNEDGQESSWQE